MWPNLDDPEYLVACARVLRRGQLTPGREVDALEAEFARHLGVSRETVVAVSSGTTALQAILQSAGLGTGDEVIVPALSFTATALAVLHVGATPVFVDVDASWNLDPRLVRDAITPYTKAILAVDLHGLSAEWSALRAIADERSLWLLEDACPAYGARYMDRPVGSAWSDAAAFSMNQTKMLAAGEGGFVVTRELRTANEVRALRTFGEVGTRGPRVSLVPGHNWKLPEITAAIARVSLDRLPEVSARARQVGDVLAEACRVRAVDGDDTDVEENAVAWGPPHPDHSEPCWHKYRVRLHRGVDRDDALKHLRLAGVPIAERDVAPLPLHPALRAGRAHGSLPVARAAVSSIVIGSHQRPLWTAAPGEEHVWAAALQDLPVKEEVA